MKLLFAGTPANAARTLEWLIDSGYNVVGVLTRPDAPVGRKRVLTASPVAEVAQRTGIRVFKANTVSVDLAQELASTGADLGVVVAYGALLKDFALQALPLGWVNLHYSLLPDWRGAAPVQRAILAGDNETGVTVFQLDEGMDTGPVFGTLQTEIQPGENSARLLARLTELGCSLLAEVLPKVESGLQAPMPQAALTQAGQKPRLASKLRRFEAEIDWSLSSRKIEKMVLGFNPEPMAFTTLGGESFRILDAVALPSGSGSSATTYGELSIVSGKPLVSCGAGSVLQLRQVQPAGRNAMLAQDWVRGLAGKTVIFGGSDA